MSHLWFPVTQDTLSKGANPGHWQGHSAQALGELASELSYDGVATQINSLPTPWSRAVQIGQAITNPHYPTREKLLDELFGCLAVVGLSGLYNLNLRSDILNLEELCNDGEEPSVHRFAASLRENKPEGSQSVLEELPEGASPWDSLIVFTIHNDRTHQSQPIGFTSPSSILCPTTQLRHEIAGVAWSRGGRFSDPTPHLSLKQHKQPLANWLHQLHQNILNYKPAESEQKDALCGVLKEFIDRLKVNPSTAPETGKIIPKVSNTSFRFLAHAAAPVKSEGNCCRVILKDKLAGDRKPVILVDPDMPRQLQKMASEIQLYKSDTLETIGRDAQSLRDRHKDINVVTPNDLFLPNLTLLPEGALCHSWLPEILTARLEVEDQEDTTPLLPFSFRLQELFSSGELKEMVRLAVDHSKGCLVVELALKLEGFEEKYRLEHSYLLKDATVRRSIPVMAIWPSIPADHWHQYWIFSQMVDGLSIDKTASWEGPHLVESGGDQVRYFCSTSFPDLLNVSVNGEPGGLIPLESPEPISVTGERWNVGLDFGTSFTNWAIWDENQAPRRLPLQSALWPVTVANDLMQQGLLNRYFLPQKMYPEDNNPPTSTSLSVVGCDPKKLDSKDVPPELFHEARLHIPQPGEAFKSHLRTGFKWEHPEFQEPFLRQLALMISAHAARAGVSKMTWSLSYPTAFDRNTKLRYESLWQRLTGETLKNISGIDQELRQDRPLLSEAVAFARCLADKGNTFQFQHTACMDIGGRTTDISLWQDSSLIRQVSVPFAGQHICTKILDCRREFTYSLFDKRLDFTQISGEMMKSNRLSLIDNYIRFESEDLLKKLLKRRYRRQNKRDKILEQFISLMALATGGLYHYLGFVVRCLYENKTLKRGSCVSVYVGGNGGKLLHWLDPICQFNQDSQVNRWLSRIQAAAINLNDNEPAENTRLSEKFKDEVATGLVVNQLHLRGFSDGDLKDKPFSGESLRINGYDFAAEQPIDLSEFDNNETVESMKLLDLKELQRYVRGMVKAMEGLRDDLQLDPVVQASDLEGPLGEKVLDRAQNLCDQHLGDRQGLKMGNFSVEPGFFLGLRALVEVLADDWAADRL